MGASGQLEAAADDTAVQDRDDRHRAILNPVECLVHTPGQAQGSGPVELRNLGQVGAGAEVVAFSMQDNDPCPLRQAAED